MTLDELFSAMNTLLGWASEQPGRQIMSVPGNLVLVENGKIVAGATAVNPANATTVSPIPPAN